ncbi:hypothetical protein [Cellulomonas soli]
MQQDGAQLPTRRSRREAERRSTLPPAHPDAAPTQAAPPRAGRVPAYASAPAPATAVFEPVPSDQPAAVAAQDRAAAAVRPGRERSTAPAGAAPARSARVAALRGREKHRRGLARAGVLSALVGVTVIVPVTHSDLLAGEAYGNEALADATLPTTLAALTASGLSAQPPPP